MTKTTGNWKPLTERGNTVKTGIRIVGDSSDIVFTQAREIHEEREIHESASVTLTDINEIEETGVWTGLIELHLQKLLGENKHHNLEKYITLTAPDILDKTFITQKLNCITPKPIYNPYQ